MNLEKLIFKCQFSYLLLIEKLFRMVLLSSFILGIITTPIFIAIKPPFHPFYGFLVILCGTLSYLLYLEYKFLFQKLAIYETYLTFNNQTIYFKEIDYIHIKVRKNFTRHFFSSPYEIKCCIIKLKNENEIIIKSETYKNAKDLYFISGQINTSIQTNNPPNLSLEKNKLSEKIEIIDTYDLSTEDKIIFQDTFAKHFWNSDIPYFFSSNKKYLFLTVSTYLLKKNHIKRCFTY